LPEGGGAKVGAGLGSGIRAGGGRVGVGFGLTLKVGCTGDGTGLQMALVGGQVFGLAAT
jgi:hypothetical protein